MRPISTEDHLPRPHTYVLARYVGGNWRDKDDQDGCVWRVVKFVPDAKNCSLNNKKPYYWREFGAVEWFGQNFDVWCELPIR